MRIMFWNTHNNNKVNAVISDIIEENGVDFVALCEYCDNIDNLLEMLKHRDIHMKKYFSVGCEKVLLLGKLPDVTAGAQETRYSIQIINGEFILCAMHLPSQLRPGNQDRRRVVIQSALEEIHRHEEMHGTTKTIILGDMNEDPYDDGCLSALNFQALPSRTDAKKGHRIIEGKKFPMLYNPMWNYFGDFKEPAGTYYYSGGNPTESFWHIFDQVIINPCLIESFDNLKILTKVGEKSLLDRHGHPSNQYSDHLPIVFDIREDRI